jgi:hypothetical protein
VRHARLAGISLVCVSDEVGVPGAGRACEVCQVGRDILEMEMKMETEMRLDRCIVWMR